jgi:L-ascorbate metabolism protein UlaG (beta-lactamase superfamily)
MKFHYYGHSCFSLTANNKTILFDPFISGNPKVENIDIDNINCDYILLSHGHADHILDCVSIAKRTGAKVICAWEIHEWLNKKGIENTHPMNTGGSWDFEDFTVKCVVAQHSSGLPDGTYGGNPMGFIIWFDSQTVYFAGDTALTLDMQLIPTWAKIDWAVLPIGNNFTMDAADASRAAQMVETKKVIGVHFDTFGFIEINHEEARSVFKEKGIELSLPEINSELDLK